ncbi:MAG: GNAT family N-acetyltransferase [Actinomycetota bacterium]|nr:GNAT family N-acetyltransferase [Actinomycetota bacterium]
MTGGLNWHVRPMTAADAAAIVEWHYEPPYDFYDFRSDPEDLAELLAPARWVEQFRAVFDDAGELVGFFDLKPRDDEVMIGLGLRPDLTGKGLGRSFLDACLGYARSVYSPGRIVLDVATFNDRARTLYERAGFRSEYVWVHQSGQGPVEFLRMSRPEP